MATSSTFFRDPTTSTALNRLADAQELTVVVGAGVAIESGFPAWRQLVHRLLVRSGKSLMPKGANEEQLDTFAEWALNADDVLGAAGLARASGQNLKDIAAVLYRDTGPEPVPGPSAVAIAQLAASTGDVEVLTTNYDDTLEEAMRTTLPDGDTRVVQCYVDATDRNDGEIGVRHLHGALDADGTARGTVILSEDDYFAMGDAAWQSEYVTDALGSRSCLFIGSSMSDPNLLRYLHRARKPRKGVHRVAVLVRQGDHFVARRAPDEHVEAARVTGTLRRWSGVHVEPLRPDWFYDSAQFLYELLARRRGDALHGYDRRIDEWQNDFDRTLMVTYPFDVFRKRQDQMWATLAAVKEMAQRTLDDAVGAGDERFVVTLWARRPGEKLLAIGTSDRAHRDPDTFEALPLEGESPWTSVRAFRRGAPLLQDTSDVHGTRWNTVVALPISITDPRYGRLQVGAMSIAGTEPPPTSALQKAGPTTRSDLFLLLEEFGAELLLPPSA